MPIFLAGLLLGGASGGVTYGMTIDGQLAAIAGAVAMVLTWLGCACLIFIGN
ncbi:hypothetical protein LZP81_31065 [Streptomyces parvulus]|uniref:hypothetical protein n=1 Tax=Streptomyces parvulus TaxID=146923 RepID=UPI001E4CB3DC|nr:hypothetical protein [Streptomyces parvulus]MCC9154855.1 hypothetical protein [Streptomyces parvulus]MCE7691300.1 hypothetical protein [Streptomyces parvulus]